MRWLLGLLLFGCAILMTPAEDAKSPVGMKGKANQSQVEEKERPEPKKHPGFAKDAKEVRKNLEILIPELPANRYPLKELVQTVEKICYTRIFIDESAMKRVREGFDTERIEVTISSHLNNVSTRAILRIICTECDMDTIILGNTLHLVPKDEALHRKFQQPVTVNFNQMPLTQAAKHLFDTYAVNIVVDQKLPKHVLEVGITLELDDSSLEVAVALLAEQAGLKVTRIGNAMFITTAENASKIREPNLVPKPQPPGMGN